MPKSDLGEKINFEAPGPGSWKQDPVHFPRPMTRYYQETYVPPFQRGSKESARFYGFLIDGTLVGFVNGFTYFQGVPVLENEISKCSKRAEEVFAKKLWREQLRDWDENSKPSTIAAHRKLQSIDPDILSDAELITYLKQCRDHHSAMIAQHMFFTPAALLPLGDFLAHVRKWTKLPVSDLLSLMRGSSNVSSGGSEEMEHLKLAFTKDPQARDILNSDGEAHEVISVLTSLGGDTGNAIRGYLDLVSNRLVDGFDISEPTAIEIPSALLRAIRISLSEEATAISDIENLIVKVRAKVPPEHQLEFDELLQEARLIYRLRDERGIYSDIWAAGIMRRAALSAGRRVASRGRITTPHQMLEASLDEMCDLVSAVGGPSDEELAQRAMYRTTHTAKEAPPLLGPPNPPQLDLTTLPPLLARLQRAILISSDEVFEGSTTINEEKLLFGLAASKGVYEGPARRVKSSSEFGRITKGDVLVTESTTEAFNILFPLLGGIITDNGGLLSHAAIISREYGIPGVVGTREGTERIRDGVRVRVDGDKGEVTVLE